MFFKDKVSYSTGLAWTFYVAENGPFVSDAGIIGMCFHFFYALHFWKHNALKCNKWGWRDGSVVQSMYCSCREPRFISQHPHMYYHWWLKLQWGTQCCLTPLSAHTEPPHPHPVRPGPLATPFTKSPQMPRAKGNPFFSQNSFYPSNKFLLFQVGRHLLTVGLRWGWMLKIQRGW